MTAGNKGIHPYSARQNAFLLQTSFTNVEKKMIKLEENQEPCWELLLRKRVNKETLGTLKVKSVLGQDGITTLLFLNNI